jgi:hypothetical protein
VYPQTELTKEEAARMCQCDRREYDCHCADAELKIARLEKQLTNAEEIIWALRSQVRLQELRLRIKFQPDELEAYLEEMVRLERRSRE